MPSVFWEYVLSPTRSGVLAAIDAAQRSAAVTKGGAAGRDPFAALTAEQRDLLRQYVATVEAVHALSGT